MTHRDEKLDALLGKRVKITWHKGCSYSLYDIGVLEYYDKFEPNIGCKAGYHLRNPLGIKNCSGITFRKSHVKKVEVYNQ